MNGVRSTFAGRVIFDHLVKAGGQAVNAWLRVALGTACVTNNLSGNHRELIQRYGGEFSVISSHVAFFGEGLDPRYQYFTCLREPIDRTISQLFFTVNNHEEIELPNLWRKVEKLLAAHGVQGGGSKGESGDDPVSVSLDDIPLTTNYYVNHFAAVLPGDSEVGSDKLRRAMRAIDEYDFWGIYEEMPKFVEDVAGLLEIPAPQRIARLNQTNRRLAVHEIPASLRRHVEEMNALDLEFYHELRSRYLEARKQWYRQPPVSSHWTPRKSSTNRVSFEPEFVLVAAKLRCALELSSEESLVLQLEFSLNRELGNIEIGVHVFDDVGGFVFGTNSSILENSPIKGSSGLHQVLVSVPASLPTGAYTAGFTVAEQVENGTREVARYNQLFSFQVELPVHARATGRLNLPALIDHQYICADVVRLAEQTHGRMTVEEMPTTLGVDTRIKLHVKVFNDSVQDWHGSEAHPLNISYHWLTEGGEILVSQGERSPFPGGLLERGAMIDATMELLTPASPGRCRLVAMPVQEGYCWFDEKGFSPLELELTVAG